jgi:hypothetical protein
MELPKNGVLILRAFRVYFRQFLYFDPPLFEEKSSLEGSTEYTEKTEKGGGGRGFGSRMTRLGTKTGGETARRETGKK